MEDMPDLYIIESEACGGERLDLAPEYARFRWKNGREERYSAEELEQKIKSENRSGDDKFVEAFARMTYTRRTGRIL